jgi:hypothetical protein
LKNIEKSNSRQPTQLLERECGEKKNAVPLAFKDYDTDVGVEGWPHPLLEFERTGRPSGPGITMLGNS